MNIQNNPLKILIISVFVLVSLFLIFYFHFILKQSVVFTHFFYLPIIFSSIWWGRNSIFVALFLASTLIVSHYFDEMKVNMIHEYVRAFSFVVVSYIVAFLSEKYIFTEEKYRLSDANLRTIYDNSVQALLLLDKNRNIITYNNEAKEYYRKYRNKHIKINETMDNNVALNHRDEYIFYFDKVLKGETIKREWELVDHNGVGFWVEIIMSPVVMSDGSIESICFSIYDITAHKKTEIALARSEERFMKLVKYSSDIIAVIEADGSVQFISSSVERILNITVESIIGKSIFDLLHEDDIIAFESFLSNAMASEGIKYSPAMRLRRNADWVYVEAISNNLVDDEIIKGIIVNFRDISNRTMELSMS